MTTSILKGSLATWLSSTLCAMSRRDAKHTLKRMGWESIGCGCESEVFGKRGVTFVVKLTYTFEDLDMDFCEGYSEQIPERIEMTKKDRFFAETEISEGQDFYVILQERADEVPYWTTFNYKGSRQGQKKLIKKICQKYDFRDIRSGNVGFFQGILKAFDWQREFT